MEPIFQKNVWAYLVQEIKNKAEKMMQQKAVPVFGADHQ